jgi:hypothetical protein
MCCVLPTSEDYTTTMMNESDDHDVKTVFTSVPYRAAAKHVRFQIETEICPESSPLDKLDGVREWNAVWYHISELEDFRGQARAVCRHMRTLDGLADESEVSNDSSGQHKQTPKTPSLARDPLTRGLEQRSCLERQRRKFLASRFILKAATKLQPLQTQDHAEKLAAVAQRCTAWATELAVEEAARDYYRAYEVSMRRQAPAAGEKRPVETTVEQQHRRVRSRPSIIED